MILLVELIGPWFGKSYQYIGLEKKFTYFIAPQVFNLRLENLSLKRKL